ncbi:glycosyltransferase family 2 protein [bacterium]|nr:glycosyltransferase family 2 protein [bacterium]
MRKKPEISLIICTHNRADILELSIPQYQNLIFDGEYEILYVLNACTDHSIDILKQHQAQNHRIRYVEEKDAGHSIARNTGYINAEADFVFYMDDDAYPEPELLNTISKRRKEVDLACLSGHTKYWRHNDPKWIKPEFVEVPKFRSEFGLMPDSGYINGCACGFRKSLLAELGGFNPELGMKRKNLGYYDEIYIQEELKKKEVPIYYDPNLIVHHMSHQKTMTQFFEAARAKGRQERSVRETSKALIWRRLISEALLGIARFPAALLRDGYKAAMVGCFTNTLKQWNKI